MPRTATLHIVHVWHI